MTLFDKTNVVWDEDVEPRKKHPRNLVHKSTKRMPCDIKECKDQGTFKFGGHEIRFCQKHTRIIKNYILLDE